METGAQRRCGQQAGARPPRPWSSHFPLHGQPHPRAPWAVLVNPAWAFAFPVSEILHSWWSAALGGIILALLAALAGRCYFWLIYIFPYVSKAGQDCSNKILYVSCKRVAQLTYHRSRRLGPASCSQSSQLLLPPLFTTHLLTQFLWDGETSFQPHLPVKNASAN